MKMLSEHGLLIHCLDLKIVQFIYCNTQEEQLMYLFLIFLKV